MAEQAHLRFIHTRAIDVARWIWEASITVNGILRGGPFPLLWRDNLTAISGARIAGASQPTFSTFKDGVNAYEFSASQINEVFCAFHIDHDYAKGTKLYPHVHWTADTTNTGVARWGFEYTSARGHAQGDVFPATTTVTFEQAFTGTAFEHMITEVADANALDGAALNLEPDSVLMCRVFREGNHANDTLTSTAFGLFVDLHYQLDRRGTPQKAPDFYT